MDLLHLHKMDFHQYDIQRDIPFYDKLNDNMIIAGGYPLNIASHIFKNKPIINDDIDIFINDKESFIELYRYLSNDDTYTLKFRGSRYYQESPCCSVINVKQGKIIFQLIYMEFDSVEFLLNTFDMDYCQFAIYKKQLCYTEQAIQALHGKKCSRYRYLNAYRLMKAYSKEFKSLFYLDDYFGSYHSEDILYKSQESEETIIKIDNIKPLLPYAPNGYQWYNFSDIYIVGLKAIYTTDMDGIKDRYVIENHKWNDLSIKYIISFVPILIICDGELQPDINEYASIPKLLVDISIKDGNITLLSEYLNYIPFDRINIDDHKKDGKYRTYGQIHGLVDQDNKLIITLSLYDIHDIHMYEASEIPIIIKQIWWKKSLDISSDIKNQMTRIIQPQYKSARK